MADPINEDIEPITQDVFGDVFGPLSEEAFFAKMRSQAKTEMLHWDWAKNRIDRDYRMLIIGAFLGWAAFGFGVVLYWVLR